MGDRKYLAKYSRIMMFNTLPNDYDKEMHEIYLGYGRYAMAKPYNIKWNEVLKCYLVEFRWNPKETYTK